VRASFKKWLPLAFLVMLFVLAIYFRVDKWFSFSMLKQHHDQLLVWRDQHFLLASLLFIVTYTVVVMASIPGATLLTIMGGFLFGIFWGTVLVVASATMGATFVFLAVKTALGDWLSRKASGWVKRMEVGFARDEFNYLLFLRLVPLFPFFAINIVAGLLNVRLRHYVLATLIGIIPGSLVYVLVGNGLSSVFANNEEPNLGILFQPSVFIPILALGVLALVPIFYRRYKRKSS